MDYTLKGKTYTLDADDQKVCVDHPPKVKEDWSKDKYEPYKQKLKKAYYLGQYDRCAYCRGIIEGDAYYEPLDHIIAKAARPDWLLEPKNLIVTCDRCNNRKGTEPTVTAEALAGAKFPDDEKDYLIFNPHFDNWADHLQFEEDIFITPVVGSKGEKTIKVCKLDQYHVIINRAKEKSIGQKTPAQKILHRLKKLKGPDAEKVQRQLYDALDHFLDRVQDDPNFS